ncbi:hypothetical protein BrevBR_01040 [Brevundimonas sp. BR2-1]|uniref:hypothetical protein n=1 Tax=unclassified Brevundimonas TaxID=2622653 RepID=UPI0025C0ACA2|nr:hypothetical protein [Brevundimonas sp. UBA7664]
MAGVKPIPLAMHSIANKDTAIMAAHRDRGRGHSAGRTLPGWPDVGNRVAADHSM